MWKAEYLLFSQMSSYDFGTRKSIEDSYSAGSIIVRGQGVLFCIWERSTPLTYQKNTWRKYGMTGRGETERQHPAAAVDHRKANPARDSSE